MNRAEDFTPEMLEKLTKIRDAAIEKNSPPAIIRGIEIVRWSGSEWVVNSKYRPNELALSQAKSDLKWLQDRYPLDMYELRTLVSLKAPVEQAKPTEEPLTLEADEDATTELELEEIPDELRL